MGRRIRLAVGIGALLCAAAAAAAVPDDVVLEAMAGRWSHRPAPGEEEALERAIQEATADLGWALGGAVRAFLRSRIAPAERLDVRWREGELRIERDGERRDPLPLGFPSEPWDGARAAVEPDGSLVVRWYGRFASGVRGYTLLPDDTLRVEQALTSDRFSAPLRFSTTYHRNPSQP